MAPNTDKVRLKMRPTKLVIFGSPNAGTPLMLAAPSIAIDLPLKMLIWEDGEGTVWVSYNTLTYLQERHGVPTGLLQTSPWLTAWPAQSRRSSSQAIDPDNCRKRCEDGGGTRPC